MDGSSPLVAKLSHFMPLSDEDVRVLDALCLNEERFAANIDIVHEGDVPRSAFVLTHGVAFRYRLMPEGKRQILSFIIPGDIFGLHGFLLKAMDHCIATVVLTRIASIARDTVFDLFDHPRIGAALWWAALQEEAINRERIVALGRRSSGGRVCLSLMRTGVAADGGWARRGLCDPAAADAGRTRRRARPDLRAREPHPARVSARQSYYIGAPSAHLARCREAAGDRRFQSNYLHLGSAPTEARGYIDMRQRELERRERAGY